MNPPRTVLCFDHGSQRIGVAIGNTLTGRARPLSIVKVAGVDRTFAEIEALLGQWKPDLLVVGRPLRPDGSSQPATLAAEKFARRLEGRFRLTVHLVDERYSTLEARSRMREDRDANRLQARIQDGDDSYAAAVVLDQFLATGRDACAPVSAIGASGT
ncbi:MAG: Holliday junction resolvase RuvX [Lautropia sp.]